jgi:hypothetical protein
MRRASWRHYEAGEAARCLASYEAAVKASVFSSIKANRFGVYTRPSQPILYVISRVVNVTRIEKRQKVATTQA